MRTFYRFVVFPKILIAGECTVSAHRIGKIDALQQTVEREHFIIVIGSRFCRIVFIDIGQFGYRRFGNPAEAVCLLCRTVYIITAVGSFIGRMPRDLYGIDSGRVCAAGIGKARYSFVLCCRYVLCFVRGGSGYRTRCALPDSVHRCNRKKFMIAGIRFDFVIAVYCRRHRYRYFRTDGIGRRTAT